MFTSAEDQGKCEPDQRWLGPYVDKRGRSIQDLSKGCHHCVAEGRESFTLGHVTRFLEWGAESDERGLGVARNGAFGTGQTNKNGRSGLGSLLDGDGAGMVLDNLADDSQTQASAIGLAKADKGIE